MLEIIKEQRVAVERLVILNQEREATANEQNILVGRNKPAAAGKLVMFLENSYQSQNAFIIGIWIMIGALSVVLAGCVAMLFLGE